MDQKIENLFGNLVKDYYERELENIQTLKIFYVFFVLQI